MYKTILAHVDADDQGSADRVAVAANLARDCGATLIGAAVRLSDTTIAVLASGGAAIAGGVIADQGDGLTEAFAAARVAFDRGTDGIWSQVAWRTVVDFPTAGLANMAGVADLIVVGSQAAPHLGGAYTTVDVGELAMRAGRPVLAIPRGVARLNLGAAVVAWRNTREARRAVADALPLLATAKNVTVVHIRERGNNEEPTVADARAFLAGHGIAAETTILMPSPDGAGLAIIDFAHRAKAGLIVAGAYGHARAREWAFGGVTRDLTHNNAIPTLLSR